MTSRTSLTNWWKKWSKCSSKSREVISNRDFSCSSSQEYCLSDWTSRLWPRLLESYGPICSMSLSVCSRWNKAKPWTKRIQSWLLKQLSLWSYYHHLTSRTSKWTSGYFWSMDMVCNRKIMIISLTLIKNLSAANHLQRSMSWRKIKLKIRDLIQREGFSQRTQMCSRRS